MTTALNAVRRLGLRPTNPVSVVSYKFSRRFSSQMEDITTENLRYHLKTNANRLTRDDLLAIYKLVPHIQPAETTATPAMKIAAEWDAAVVMRPAFPSPYATGCYANRSFKKDDVIMELKGEITGEATFESIQIKEGAHLQMLKPAVTLNHDCDPNGYIDFENLTVCALKDIKEGEQVTWDFNTSEWIIQRPFKGRRGESVAGFQKLSTEKKAQLQKYASPFIRDMLGAKMAMINQDSTITP